MSDGIEIAVQIRTRDTETVKDLPTYYTATNGLGQDFLDEYDSEQVVEEVMRTAVREVVAEWSAEVDD
jgi:hypothetical protein